MKRKKTSIFVLLLSVLTFGPSSTPYAWEAAIAIEPVDYLDLPPRELKEESEPLSSDDIDKLFCEKMQHCDMTQIIPPDSRVVNGELLTESWYSHVRQIITVDVESGLLGLCTGTFVSKRIMVTAAHCIEKTDWQYGVFLKKVGRHYDPSRPSDWVETTTRKYRIHPGYLGITGIESASLDIAILEWRHDINSVNVGANIAAPFPAPIVERPINIMGFGNAVWEHGYQGNPFIGQLRRGYNTIQQMHPEVISVVGRTCTQFDYFGPCQFNGNMSTGSHGDSGGPLFPNNSAHYLLGILCCGGTATVDGTKVVNVAHYAHVWSPTTRSFLKPALIEAGYPVALFPPGY